MHQMAFDANTDTLLLLVRPAGKPVNSQLLSLRRNGSEWVEVQRLDTNFKPEEINIAVCDSRVLLGQKTLGRVLVFDVSANHILRADGFVDVRDPFYEITCTRRGVDTFLHSFTRKLYL